ncbi:hypothetical protein [Microbacterium sp. 10M-3C3]|jgi:hypothetical protein|uniref:hypothetical protein n=1 Tax=Microbacterium sp. 10M-3C3 TaxID=2483401 RepID=UPI000F63CE8A|nr:hypothetical protein [Microbacterium sp. 10M-3C3]
MTALLATGVIRDASRSERAVLRLSAALQAAVLAHAARRQERGRRERAIAAAVAVADIRRACVHVSLLPR